MYPPFLTSILASKGLHSYIWKCFTKIIHQLSIDLHTTQALSLSITAVILASSTPITEEHTKLLDHLSEPSSLLSHCISYPLEEEVSAEVLNSCFICIQVHGFASCILTFCKKDLSVTVTSEKPSQK